MANVLSQQQIDELLGNLRSGELDIDQVEQQQTKQKVKEYDFRSPRKITKDQIKYLTNIFDNFGNYFSMKLTSVLRQSCQIEAIQVEEEEYKEFNNALDDSVLVGMFEINCDKFKSDDNEILVEISRPLSYQIMDLLLGGSGSSQTKITRDYTDIELSIMQYVFNTMVSPLNQAWSSHLEVKHTFETIETNSRIIQFVPNDVTIAIIVMEVTIQDIKGIINVCVPTTLFEKMFPLIDTRAINKKGDERREEQRLSIITSLKKTQLDVAGILGSTEVQLQDLLGLQQGDVIILNDRRITDQVELAVEGESWYVGNVGVVDKNYGIEINGNIN